jgi:hypothetical protein
VTIDECVEQIEAPYDISVSNNTLWCILQQMSLRSTTTSHRRSIWMTWLRTPSCPRTRRPDEILAFG